MSDESRTADSVMLEAAADYAAQGWAVFPCWWVEPDGSCGCGKDHADDENSIGKHPLFDRELGLVHGHKDASSDAERVTLVWTKWPKASIAYEPGRHGHLVVDVDLRSVGDASLEEWELFNALNADGSSLILPPTRTANTGGGGFHHFYSLSREKIVNSRNAWLPGVDIKSTGGYVVLPPSTHRSGKRYTWNPLATGIEPAPELFLAELQARSPGARPGSGPRPGTSFNAVSTDDILASGFPEGERDNGLFKLACRLRRQFGDNRAEIEAKVLQAAAACRPPFPRTQALRKVEQAFKQDYTDDWMKIDWDLLTGHSEEPAEEKPATKAPPPGAIYLPDEFWETRPVLQHVRTFARSRRVAPDAVLGVVLTRVTGCIHPNVTLPAIVGGRASLNTFIALVGKSGAGKGVTLKAAEDAVAHDPAAFTVETPGSGEGIAHAYMQRGDAKAGEPKVVQHQTSVLFDVAEIDTFVALGSRNGATLLPEIRKAWSGEQLGFAYADPSRKMPVPAHSYRMGLIVGVQPGRSKSLLDDADGGTPQRFVWLSTSDPAAPDVAPAEPDAWRWRHPLAALADACTPASRDMAVCARARTDLDTARLERLRDPDKAEGVLDGHRGLARLKIAAALAILDGRLDVQDEDWGLAAIVIETSDAVRADVQRHLHAQARESAHARAVAAGHAAVTTEEVASERRARRVAALLMKHVEAAGEDGLTKGSLRKKIHPRDRGEVPGALERAIAAGLVEVVNNETISIIKCGRRA